MLLLSYPLGLEDDSHLPDNSASKPIRKRADGRRALLVYLDEDLIKSLKKSAVDEDRNVYDIVEDATRAWLKTKNKKSGSGEAS